MKRLRVMLLGFVVLQQIVAQTPSRGIQGAWLGALVFGQAKMTRIHYFSPPHGGAYTGVVIDPDSGDGTDMDPIAFANGKLTFEVKADGYKFEGTLSPDGEEIKGKFLQGGFSADLVLTRVSPNVSHVADQYEAKEIMIPVRDGINLHTIVYAPKTRSEPLPFLIHRSPYGWSAASQYIDSALSDLARDGYFLVFQDIRGRYKSEGKFVMQRPVRNAHNAKSIDEGTDAYDTIDWLVKHIPGNNGRAGIMGVSYGGWLTEMALIQPHSALKAASEQASPADMFLGDDFHHNGAFRLSYGFEYAAMMEAGNSSENFDFKQFDTYDWYLKLGPLREANARYLHRQRPTWNNFIAHPNYDEFWQKLAVQNYVGSGRVPNLNVGGWFDQEDFAGPWRIFEASETPQSRRFNYLVVGPWNHGGWSRGTGRRLQNIDFGSNTGEYFREKIQARWFAYWLKDKGAPDLARIFLFETGLNEWRAYDQWPPRGVQHRKLYLHGSGEASFDAPSNADEAFDSFVSDPRRPVPYREPPIPQTYGGSKGWGTWLVDDQRFAETRPDVAVWETKPLQSDVRVAGDIIGDLFASTSGTDSDWIIKLIDVYPANVAEEPSMGGYELMIAADVLRGRFRNSFSKPEPVTPHQPVEYKLDLLSHDHMFRKGHRIMVQIQSTWFPLIDRNPQKFVPNIFEAADSDFQVATQAVFRSKTHPSAIVLPVIGPR
ncbi:MAG: CocE/NonD family hydrolase [Acidobacteriaceae bacterium]|nr:CocE/NonD family hydrolase [Acidobacteriaceae bacterium]MBV9294990.1 CocE/NonD family hydrolase [Acidobacteriaceae bacterium]MBV9766184.1 CocE/NonD family hydrolase [Acidobacteriaceae bacterium]